MDVHITEPFDSILVAARGSGREHGLYVATDGPAREWDVRQLDTAEEIAALCGHPSLPIVYGLSGLNRGRLLAWDVAAVRAGGAAPRVVDLDTMGDISCDLAVSPDGGILVAANYGYETAAGGSLTLWRLDEHGSPMVEGEEVLLRGSGPDPQRQSVPHPHQIVFHGEVLLVPDLGAERIRRFGYGRHGLRESDALPTPPGTGPRHLVVAGPELIAVSGELSGDIVVGRPDPVDPAWRTARASSRTGPATTRSDRNYPGDLKLAPDARYAYFANRGYDTIATVALDGDVPRLASEIDATTAWPQHLLVRERDLLVAGWDGSTVVRMPVTEGVPGEPEVAFECSGAGWLLRMP
jgi:6-phosphogluconolactonase